MISTNTMSILSTVTSITIIAETLLKGSYCQYHIKSVLVLGSHCWQSSADRTYNIYLAVRTIFLVAHFISLFPTGVVNGAPRLAGIVKNFSSLTPNLTTVFVCNILMRTLHRIFYSAVAKLADFSGSLDCFAVMVPIM